MPNMDMMSFLAVWFNNLRKNIFKVEVINQSKVDTTKLEASLNKVSDDLRRLPITSLDNLTTVSKQQRKELELLTAKLDSIVSQLKTLPDGQDEALSGYIRELSGVLSGLKPKDIQRVEVTNQREVKVELPKETKVTGKVEVSNLPKVQKVEGDVEVKDLKKVVDGLQVVVDAISDLKMEMDLSIKSIPTHMATVGGGQGSTKISDGTDIATITAVGSNKGLDVNVVAGGTSGTQYSEGDVDTSVTGTAIMWEDASDTLRAVSSGKPLPVNIVAGGAGDGAILDGASSSLKASVLDLASVNPLTVAVLDGTGTQITSFGGGTQYTEDAAAAANPVGTAPILVRTDTPATQVTTDGDNIAQRGTNYGAAYVQLVTSAGAYIDSVGGGTEYTEDVATANPIVGKAIMVERDDVLSVVTPVEADNIGLRGTAEGALWTQDFNSDAILADTTAIKTAVEILDNTVAGSEMQVDIVSAPTLTVNAHAVTNAGTFAVQVDGAALTALQLIDDAVYADDGAWTGDSSKHTLVGGIYQSVPQTVTDGRVAPISLTSNGSVRVAVQTMPTTNVNISQIAGAGATAWSGSSSEGDGGIIALAVRNDTATTTLTNANLDYAVAAVDLKGRQFITGDTSMVALKVDGSAVTQPVSGTITAVTAITNALPAGDNNIGNVDIVTLPALAAGTNNIGDVDVLSIIPGTGATNLGKAIDTATGATDTGVLFLATRDDALSALTPVEGDNVQPRTDANGALWTHDDALDAALAGSELQVDVVAALPAGTNAIGKLAANSGVDIGDVDVTSISAGTNAIGDTGFVTRATGAGTTTFRSIDIDETEEEVKATAGQVYKITAFNLTAAPLYLKFYNLTAANTTVGTSTPVLTFVVPGNADSDGAGFIESSSVPWVFDTAISVACTTGVADADTGAPAANACVINIAYK